MVGVVIVVVLGSVVVAGVWAVRGLRALASEPLERVDFWSVPHQPRPAVERFRLLGFEPIGAARIGVGDNALYRSVCWSDRYQAYAWLTSGGLRVPVDGKPMFRTLVHGGSLVTLASVPEHVLPHLLEQGFPRRSVDELLDRHLRALTFLENEGVPRAPVDPTAWFAQMQLEYREERGAVNQMGSAMLLLKLLRVLLEVGAGPLEHQRNIVTRLHQAPFASEP